MANLFMECLHRPSVPADAKPRKTLADLQGEHPAPPAKRHTTWRKIPPSEAAEQSPVRNYVRDLILGFNDGLVSVYAIVAGVAGAGFLPRAVAVAGLAASVAGALSMGLGEYLSTKSQTEYYAAEAGRERAHIREFPALERAEVREMLEEKDYPPEVIASITDHVTSDEDRFVDFMMREEFGVGQESERSPLIAMGLVMVAFVIGAIFPVLPFFIVAGTFTGLAWASVLSLGGLFGAGALKAFASGINPWKSGVEMMALGLVAAAITYGVGTLFGVAV